jgi:hypothetical protein
LRSRNPTALCTLASLALRLRAQLTRFTRRTPENADHNQYWYSPHTIATLIQARRLRGRQCAALALTAGAPQELELHATRIAFVSTPSVYFSLPKGSALARSSMVFDVRQPCLATRPHQALTPLFGAQIDQQWKSHVNFTSYDFTKPEEVPEALHHQARLPCVAYGAITADHAFCCARSLTLCCATRRSSPRRC